MNIIDKFKITEGKILLALVLFLGCNAITESEISKSEANTLERTRSQIAVVGEVFTATW